MYLGHIKQTENCPDIFVSVMPETIDKEKVSNILAGDLSIAENNEEKIDVAIISSEDTSMTENNISLEEGENKSEVAQATEVLKSTELLPTNQWTRMDSFAGGQWT